MAKLRKIQNEAEARGCLAAVEAAGVGLAEWARSLGIDGRSLNAWRANLARANRTRRDRPTKRATTIAVTPRARGLIELVPAKGLSSARYVIQLGIASVELGDDFRDETLRRIVGVLRSC